MQKSYLIDGYNLLHAMGVLTGKVAHGGLESARKTLLDLLAQSFAENAPCLTVVFDAARSPRGVSPEQEHRGIQVRFAKGRQEADDVIEDLLAQHPHPKQLAIVSNDRRLLDAARRRRAQPMDCDAFLDVLEQKPSASTAQTVPQENPDLISPEETGQWLKEFGDAQKDLDRLGPY